MSFALTPVAPALLYPSPACADTVSPRFARGFNPVFPAAEEDR